MSPVRKGYIRPVDFKHGRVDMSHGSGGRAMAQLIEELFLAAFDNEWLAARNDQACFALPAMGGRGAPAGRMVMATDSHVVSPLFFPGGDIGCLSVHGTINDVVYLGQDTRYIVTLDVGGRLVVTQQNLSTSSTEALAQQGKPVRLIWKRQHDLPVTDGVDQGGGETE